MSANDEYLIPLVALLARSFGQHGIATILNEREIPNPSNGKPWNQTAISRYMQQAGIVPRFTLKISPYEKHPN
ncbi:hypothetical protein [Thiobacillus sp.]|uniref:hypothetical protein n=1 Tax=Thiobacillus sp. TaxID=924 RepID=UPI0025FA0959|nr:hypothetical protein [Thiobacillus sp.]MBT9540382.1 hypothetical protein [Thiobacillus sp.]